MNEDFDERLERLAAMALRAAIDRDWSTSHQAIAIINSKFGGAGLVDAMSLWCGALINHMGGYGLDKLPVGGIRFEADGADRVESIEDVRPQFAWAARLITACQVEDRDTWDALILVVANSDNNQAGRYVQGLLTVVSATLVGHLQHCPVGIGGTHFDDEVRPKAAAFPPPPPGHTWN